MINHLLRKAMLLSVLGTLLLLLANSAQARDYMVEVVLFENLQGSKQNADGLYYPKLGNTISLGTEGAVAAGYVPLEQNLQLSSDASAIASSSRYRLIRHLAWRQPGLSQSDSLPVRISIGDTSRLYLPDDISNYREFIPASRDQRPGKERQVNTYQINGSIQVYLGRFLHMDTRLVYTDAQAQQSFRLSQSRKMRSRELHYIDNPRFGILTRITPIDEPG